MVLAVEGCPSVAEGALRALVLAELGPVLVEGDAAGAERVVVSCEGEEARVTIENPPEAPVARAVSLAGFPPDARPRLLALVAVELIAARRPEVRERLAAREPVRPPPPSSVVREAAPALAPRRELRLSGGGGARAFLGARGLLTWTAGLRVEPGLTSRVALALDADVGTGRRSVAAGAIDGLMASGGAALRLRRPLGASWGLAGGTGLRFGVVSLAGAPARAEDGARRVVRAWGGPLVTVALELQRGHGVAALGLEGGWALVGARGLAGDSLALAVTGPWLGMALSAGWR